MGMCSHHDARAAIEIVAERLLLRSRLRVKIEEAYPHILAFPRLQNLIGHAERVFHWVQSNASQERCHADWRSILRGKDPKTASRRRRGKIRRPEKPWLLVQVGNNLF